MDRVQLQRLCFVQSHVDGSWGVNKADMCHVSKPPFKRLSQRYKRHGAK